jgi:hypothetical protein
MPVFGQVPMGEGYYYFDRCQNKFIVPADCPTTIWQYDNLARISFQAMIPLFKDNIHLYMFTQVFVSILLYIVMYLVLFKITKNSFFAFVSVLMFLSSHTGSFSMMAIGNYQRFVQRVPNLILVSTSFFLLNKFLENRKFKDLVYFCVSYLFSIYLAHHSLFMMPLFVVYIFFKKKRYIDISLIIFIVISSLILTKTDHFVPKGGIIEFIKNTPYIIDKTLLQIPNLIIPTELVRLIAKNWPIAPIPYPFTFILKLFLIPVLTLLVLPILFAKDKGNIKLLYLTVVISLPIVCFLNLYAYGDGAPHSLRDFGEDRIYFIPSIFSSIILGYYANLIWNNKNKLVKIFTILIITGNVLYNSYLIDRDANKLNETSQKMEMFINFVKNETEDRDIKLKIIGPSHLLWPMQFVTLFYNSNNNLVFALDSSSWDEIIKKQDFDRIEAIDYVEGKITRKIIK